MLSITATPTFKRVGDAFNRLGSGSMLKEALENYAYALETESKRQSPVDTGRMRASIFTTIGDLRALIKPDVFYAGFVHWGTYKMRARPFMQWAINTVPVDKRFSAVVQEKVEKEINNI